MLVHVFFLQYTQYWVSGSKPSAAPQNWDTVPLLGHFIQSTIRCPHSVTTCTISCFVTYIYKSERKKTLSYTCFRYTCIRCTEAERTWCRSRYIIESTLTHSWYHPWCSCNYSIFLCSTLYDVLVSCAIVFIRFFLYVRIGTEDATSYWEYLDDSFAHIMTYIYRYSCAIFMHGMKIIHEPNWIF